ncbi:MAG: NAD(+) diphosphatase [Microbacterium sp.]|nr:MAG: NAD(+) diphosphatase [Microbacterium sp.]
MPRSDTPQPPALARAGIDRAADERDEPGILGRLRADPATLVVAVHGDLGLVESLAPRLHTVAVEDVRPGVEWALLGRTSAGAAVLLAVSGSDAPAPTALPEDASWRSLRAAGGDLEPVDAGLLVEAVALGRWLVEAPFCPACGARTEVRMAGWSRHCPSCGREHFPRTDPAVIVAIESADGERLLLGKNALWADRNVYSTFAGFVEAGESLESTIVREVREEAGVTVEASTYRGSQSWPYPRSLMLGFRATVAADAVPHPDGVEIVDARWFDRAELRRALAGEGEVGLPGSASIAHRLIVDWVEEVP